MMRRAYKNTVIVGIGLLGAAYGQVGVIFSVSGSKPLAKAAEEFEAKYGIPISYEDPAYAYPGELVDHTDPGYSKSHPEGPRALSLKGGGSLVLHADPKMAVRSSAAAMPLLQSLLDEHVRAGYPGEFKLVPNGDGVAIVPVAVRNLNGVSLPDQSPLETTISLPESKRTAMETLNAICGAIRNNSGKNIGVASGPFIGTQPYSVTIGAANEPARSVLQRTLAGLEYVDTHTQARIPKMAWSLLYDPGQKVYLLNVHQVLKEVLTPTGRTIRRPVAR
jgi:hypothetical protein